MALLNALTSKDTILLEGLQGEVYTIKLGDPTPVRGVLLLLLLLLLTDCACDEPDKLWTAQVDLSDPSQLVQYFSNPRWEAALQRTPVDIGQMQSAFSK